MSTLRDKLFTAKVEAYNTARALKKIKRHPNSIDVKGIGKNSLKEMKTEDKSISQDDMETEIDASKKDESNLRHSNPKAFIGGPCSWNPYSKGVNVDELKTSLASRAVLTPKEDMDISTPVKPEAAESLGDADPEPSAKETDGDTEQTKKAKTLKDAVKPKHKRRKKNMSNTDGS